ncbi:kinase-like domain-containing protein [Aspergillus crustosus]
MPSEQDPESACLAESKPDVLPSPPDIVEQISQAWFKGGFAGPFAITHPEPDESYYPGGHAPLHFGDHFGPRAKYRIVQKLGVGSFGIFFTSDYTRNNRELNMLLQLNELGEQDQNIWRYALCPHEGSQLEAGDGTVYDYLVYPVGAPQKRSLHIRQTNMLSPFQDFRPQNILARIDSFNGVSPSDIYCFLPPDASPVTHQFTDPNARPTRYIVYPAETPNALNQNQTTAELSVIDWGESFSMDNPPEYRTGIPLEFASPELVLDRRCGAASDIWALACTMIEIRIGLRIFYLWNSTCETSYLYQIVDLLGIPLEPLWARVSGQWRQGLARYSPDLDTDTVLLELTSLRGPARDRQSVRRILAQMGARKMCEKEEELFSDLVGGMLVWEPDRRLAIEQVLQHPWFSYEPDASINADSAPVADEADEAGQPVYSHDQTADMLDSEIFDEVPHSSENATTPAAPDSPAL